MATDNCRTCGRILNDGDKGDCVNLFEPNHYILLQRLEIMVGVQITYKEFLPVFMCAQCQQYLQQAMSFREICIITQQVLTEEADKKNQVKSAATYIDDDLSPFSSFISKREDIKNQHIEDETTFKDSNELNLELISDKEIQSRNDYDDETNSDNDKEYELAMPAHGYRKRKVVEEENRKWRKEIKSQREFICDQCGEHFCNYTNFKEHQLIHIGLKDFKCYECNVEFHTKHMLTCHEHIRHKGEANYVCKFCDKTFKSGNQKIRHERKYHTQERPFQCRYCPKYFVCSSFRQQHEMSHRNTRTFKCKLCDHSFNMRKIVLQHYKSKTHKENLKQQENFDSSFN